MSVLSLKLQQAAKLFQSHNFKKSLETYQDCINFCYKTDQAQSIIFNILSAKATLEYILGDYDGSLGTLNSVLKKDPNHFLCLLRRSQAYKKKNKLKKALKDLSTIFVFCPDNLQISAFKVQIQNLLLKQQHQTTSQSEQEDEQDQLNFIKLKQIDRKSSEGSAIKERKSRVTILGDTTFQYKRDEQTAESKQSENRQDKAIRTYRQIQLDDDSQNQSVPVISIKAPRRGKSILKNKGTSIFIHGEDLEARRSRYLGRQSKFLILLKNIDGKIIPSADRAQTNHSNREVQFRKSINLSPNDLFNFPPDNQSMSSSRQRKSCLKRPSFQVPILNSHTHQKSRFQSIDSSKIDGHIIVQNNKRKSIDKHSEANSQGQIDEVKHDSDSDNGSEHNIFGSKQFVMSNDIKHQLGFTEDLSVSQQQYPRIKGKKSILKKNSSVILMSANKKTSYQQQHDLGKSNMSLRSKKSVMFNCTL